jgi:hypothetical protein
MTTSKSNALSLSAKKWTSGDRNLIKALIKEMLQEVLDTRDEGVSRCGGKRAR